MTVDVWWPIQDVTDNLGGLVEKSNKACIIVACIADTYKIIHFNDTYLKLTQFTDEEVRGSAFQSMFIESQYRQAANEIVHNLQQRSLFEMKIVHKKKQGTFWAKINVMPFGDEYYFVSMDDITTSRLSYYIDRLEQKMFISIEKNLTFHEQISFVCREMDALFYPHMYTMFTLKMANDFVTILSNEHTGFDSFFYTVTDQDERLLYKNIIEGNEITYIQNVTKSAMNDRLKCYLIKQGLTQCWMMPIVSKGEVIGVMTLYFASKKHDKKMYEPLLNRLNEIIATCYELNNQRLLIEDLAYIDQATGLPNMHHFKKTLKELEKQGIYGFVKVVKASEFSDIVKLYGRAAGDQLLQQLGERFQQTAMGKVLHIARFTSSSLIIFSTRDLEKARFDHTPFFHITATPFRINESDTYITLKAGFALFNEELSCDDSIRFAELALEKANTIAGTQIEYYEEHIDTSRERAMHVLKHLTEALHKKEITTYFQPKVMLYHERIASVEALARWHSPELGFVSPAEFIPVAEQAGLICELDLLMLEQVFRWMQQRLYAGKKILPVAINISPVHFYHPDFVMHVQRLLECYYIDPQFLIIEVTESIGLKDLKRAKTILCDLHRLGIKTSVDDFGIGYSSLSYLQNFSFQELKIDRSFTWKLHEVGTYTIVKAIIDIARTLEMTVIAEGVETAEQVALLKQLRCDIAQGYYYYKPMSMVDFERMFDGA